MFFKDHPFSDKRPFKEKLKSCLLTWAVISGILFLLFFFGFRIVEGKWEGVTWWLPIFIFASVLAPPVGWVLWKIGFQV